MVRPNAPESPAGMTPYQTPSGGMPQPAALSPFGGGFAPAAPSPALNSPTLPGLLKALKRKWVMATFLGGLIGVAAAVAVWLVLPGGKHTAKAIVQLKPPGPEVVLHKPEEHEANRRSLMFLMRSPDLLDRVMAEPSVAGLGTIRESDEPRKLIEEGIKVEMPAPDLMQVSLTGDNPDDLRNFLNALVKKFSDEANTNDRIFRNQKIVALEEVARRFKDDIAGINAAIKRMAEANQTLGSGAGTDTKLAALQQRLAQLNGELFQAEREVRSKKAEADRLQKQLAADRVVLDPDEVDAVVNDLPEVAAMARRLEDEKRLLAGSIEQATSRDAPTVKKHEAAVAELQKNLTARRDQLKPEVEKALRVQTKQAARARLADLNEKLELAGENIAFLKKFIDELGQGTGTTARASFEIEQLQNELKPQQEYYNKVLAQLTQLRASQISDSRVEPKGEAKVSLNQNLQKKVLMSSLAGVGGFVAILALVGLLEWRNRRIDGVDQVVNDLGMRIIGTVPAFPSKASLKAADRHGTANWRFVLNESINSTRTMLLHSARNQSMQVVMVTSATQGEGKTSLASQLATSMATAGMRTLIVDCDLRNPSMHKLFDIQLSPGCSEVLCQDVDASDAVQPTAVPNLWMIAAGQCSNKVIAALAQGHPLETLFNRLRGQFDFIIVDSCPVLPVADALLIGQHVDGVVFSIMQDVSQLPKVLVASEKLHQLNIPLLGAVVNGIRNDVYSYGYNYIKQLPA